MNKLILRIIFFVLISAKYYEFSDVFSSGERLIELTGSLKLFVETKLNDLEKENADFKTIGDNLRYLNDQAQKNTYEFIGNPINCFLLIKAFTKDLENYVNKTKILDDFVDEYIYYLPEMEDYKGVILSILRLQDTYLLTPTDLKNTKISKRFPSLRALNAFECFEIGRVAYENENYFYSIQWLNESLVQLKKEVDKPTIEEIKIIKYFALANAQQGNIKDVVELLKRINDIEPSLEIVEQSFKIVLDKIAKYKNENQNGSNIDSDFFKFKNKPEEKDQESENYEKLCRDDYSDFSISSKRLSKLSCRYVSDHPSLIIAPIKEELVFDEPKIWLYHDVITEDQINFIKYYSKNMLERSGIFVSESGPTNPYIRISHTGWLLDEDFFELKKLTKLISAATKLTLNVSEPWQIVNYGIGGQYEPHFDFFDRTVDEELRFDLSSRVATWLFYLDGPEKGGSTVFPLIGLCFELFYHIFFW